MLIGKKISTALMKELRSKNRLETDTLFFFCNKKRTSYTIYKKRQRVEAKIRRRVKIKLTLFYSVYSTYVLDQLESILDLVLVFGITGSPLLMQFFETEEKQPCKQKIVLLEE